MTDEDEPEPFMAAARQLQQNGYELSVLGVGTPGGAPIPEPDGGFFKDAGGTWCCPGSMPQAFDSWPLPAVAPTIR